MQPGIWKAVVVLSVMAQACAIATDLTPAPANAIGGTALRLTLPSGHVVTEVTWEISGGLLSTPMAGTINVDDQGDTVSAHIGGIPVASGYNISLAAVAGQQSCRGTATFGIPAAGATSLVAVTLQCGLPNAHSGDLIVNADFAVATCPVASMVVSPLRAQVGGTIDLEARGEDGDGLAFAWSASSGTLSASTTEHATLTCTIAGPVEVTLTAVGPEGCSGTRAAEVVCVQPCDGHGALHEDHCDCDDGYRSPEGNQLSCVTAAVRGNASLQDADTLRRIAFIHDGTRFHYYVMPGMQSTVIVGVSPDGTEAVGWHNAADDGLASPAESFVLNLETNGFTAVSDLMPSTRIVFRGASADLRYVTGIATRDDTFGFVWDRHTGTVEEVRRDDCNSGLGVGAANNAGDILGYCFLEPDFRLAAWARRAGGAFEPLSVPGAATVSPLGHNDDRWVAGVWAPSRDEPFHGFVGRPSASGYEYTSIDLPGVYETQVSGINDSGQIAGNTIEGDATGRTGGSVFRLTGLGAEPEVFDPGEGYVAISWGIGENGWMRGYIERAVDRSAVCDGHGVLADAACDCDEGYVLDLYDASSCIPVGAECSGHGHLHGDLCHCDDGYVADPTDGGACIPS